MPIIISTWFVDFVGGNDSNAGTSFATRVKTFGAAALAAVAPGNTIRVKESGAPTSVGVATWVNGSPTVSLASPVTKTITTCETTWTAGTGSITCGNGNSFITPRQGVLSASATATANITPLTKLAFLNLGSTVDFSAYQQVTFWISGNFPSTLQLRLCSDTLGAVAVDTLTIPYSSTGTVNWIPVTIDHGAALGSAIKSVALYGSAIGSGQFVILDNIEAVPASSSANSLSFNSLIGVNTADNSTWFAIKSIVSNTVTLDFNPAAPATSITGYGGANYSGTTYKRETIKARLGFIPNQFLNSLGSSGNPVNVLGGWDSSAMSTQTSETWFDGQSTLGIGLSLINSVVNFDKFYFTRWDCGIAALTGSYVQGNIAANNSSISNYALSLNVTGDPGLNILSCACNNYAVLATTVYPFSALNINNCDSNLVSAFNSTSPVTNITGNLVFRNNAVDFSSNSPVSIVGGARLGNVSYLNNLQVLKLANTGAVLIDSLTTTNNSGVVGIALAGTCSVTISNLDSSLHIYTFHIIGTQEISHYVNNAVMSDVNRIIFSNPGLYLNQAVYSQNEGGTVNNNVTYGNFATVTVDTADPNIAGGLDYKIQITDNAVAIPYTYTFSLAKFAFNAGSTVQFSAFIKKSDATNINADMIIRGGQISGFPDDMIVSATTTSYDQYLISFFPLEQGVAEVIVNVYENGPGLVNDYVQIADLGISQG